MCNVIIGYNLQLASILLDGMAYLTLFLIRCYFVLKIIFQVWLLPNKKPHLLRSSLMKCSSINRFGTSKLPTTKMSPSRAMRGPTSWATFRVASARKSSPGVNFTHILPVAFLYKSVLYCFSLLTNWLCNFFGYWILAVDKMLMKMTTEITFKRWKI